MDALGGFHATLAMDCQNGRTLVRAVPKCILHSWA